MIDVNAIISHKATIDKTAVIKAYAVIGDNVTIGANTIVDHHAIVHCNTSIGKNNYIYPYASIGGDPQDVSYKKDQESHLTIGDNNLFREFCTINRGTIKDKAITKIGSNNMFMAYVHIAHDCKLGNNIIMANNASLAGHVVLNDWVYLGGFTMIKQFCNIGEHTYTSMGCQINKDVPPYLIISGVPSYARSINSIGLKRRGFQQNTISDIKQAFKLIYRNHKCIVSKTLFDIEKINQNNDALMSFINAIRQSKLGIIQSQSDE